jgi:hypothetical protein
MQLRNTVLMLTALSALGLVMTACDTGETGSTSCTADADCSGTTDVCHPTAKICVQSCTAAADCPDTAKKCDAFPGASKNICQCSTDQLCNGLGSTSTDLVCSNVDKVCETKCTTDTDCGTGRSCDTATGQCKAGSTGTCNPACGTGQTCDPQTNTCVSSGAACTGTSQSTCVYGQFCSGTTCADAPVAPASCSNFATNRPNWSASSSNGPVIYSVSKIRYETNSSLCQTGDAYVVSVRAYRTDADWPSTRAGLSGFFYVTTDTTRNDIIGQGLLVPNTGYNRNTSNPRDAEFQTYVCPGSNVRTIQLGYFFTGGNPVCQTLTQ